jgi:hypothetical protein
MVNTFNQKPDETILYRSQPYRKWYDFAWRLGLTLFEVAIFILFSVTAFMSLAGALLSKFLSPEMAAMISGIIFKDAAPVLIIAWFAEDTARTFISELVLTNQRLWTKGSPYAWTRSWETPLDNIRSMTYRRDALFVRLKSTRRTLVHMLADSKHVVEAFTQYTGSD